MRCRTRSIRTALILATLLALSGCRELHSNESALDPAGPQAHHISTLTWLFIGVCLVVYLLVAMVVGASILHRRRGAVAIDDEPTTHPDPGGEKRVWTVVSAAILVTVVTLFGLLIADFAAGRALHRLSDDPNPLRVELTGNQWWWNVEYVDWPERYGARLPRCV